MAYLSKKTLLEAYKVLSELSEDPTVQGATQKVSAIRYFLALDMFYKKFNRECNTRDADDKAAFIANVNTIVALEDNWYTTNFYAPLTFHQGDSAVGSNFYSVGAVKNSLTNPAIKINYPQRGNKPLFEIQNGILYEREDFLENFTFYVPNNKFRCALALWICRERKVRMEDIYSTLKTQIEILFSEKVAKILLPSKDYFTEATRELELSTEFTMATITPDDIENLFLKKEKNINHTTDITSYLPYLTALRTKPFMLLAGISGTGKSRIVRELAFKSCPKFLQDQDGTTPGNYCMIEVKPNWHDSSELLGYYSNIAKQYVFTDFVKFLLKAKLYSDVPFFVCMDEMNLAPIEQYFAEFLSVLETRKQTESGIKTGALVKGQYFKRIKSVNEYDNVQTDADVYTLLEIPITAKQKEELAKTNSLKTEGLTLPENVFVIGTVNMDDTTHQFSRKVLDRAMTIEMNGGELKDMFGHSSDLEYLPEENVWKIDQFKPKHVNADEVLEEHIDSNGDLDETGIALKTQLADKLDAINQVLKDTPFVVSYRVLNELVIYAGVLLDDGKGMDEVINDAVDQITLMKILPRIEGDEDMLGNAKDENNRLYRLMKVVGPQSQAKLREMNRRLESGFTRFWP